MNSCSFTSSTTLLLLFCTTAGAVTATADLFVSPTGSDANPGSRAKPFATLEHARDAVRELKRAGKVHKAGLTVWLRGGDFLRTNALELSAADSGTLNGPFVWRAYGNERVRLLGGRALTGFQPVPDAAVLARLDEAARGRDSASSHRPTDR